MKPFQVFEDPKFGQIRTLVVEGNLYFVASDVTEALGYTKSHKAIRKHVKKDYVTKLCMTKVVVDSKINIEESDMKTFLLVNEKGVDALVSGSVHPEAKSFKEWVTSEVIPSMHDTKMEKLETENEALRGMLSAASGILECQHSALKKSEERIVELSRKLKNMTGESAPDKDSDKMGFAAKIAADLKMDPEHLNSILQIMGILKRKDGEWAFTDKFQGCSCTQKETSKD